MPCFPLPSLSRPRGWLLGLALLLPGCSGFGTFLGDTYGFHGDEHLPIGDAENVRRVEGQPANEPPLTTEPGNVWPGPVPTEPTLSDLERAQDQEIKQYRPSTPPPSTTAPSKSPPAPISGGNTSETGGNIVIPNGDGTSTVIMPDGSVRTIPTPK
ncbi:hypothetical protein [Acidibrevibacterium fodinaquatile]|uniref:hypothetical protein n=1 Tax=Acidibrevibacterium fodinaquatile TaxID=1969806 RepID=UPI0013B45E45|nr:hypothetical protein [Acidibrevibacterium fodinaquatile]